VIRITLAGKRSNALARCSDAAKNPEAADARERERERERWISEI
jgi:hypothetical protein